MRKKKRERERQRERERYRKKKERRKKGPYSHYTNITTLSLASVHHNSQNGIKDSKQ